MVLKTLLVWDGTSTVLHFKHLYWSAIECKVNSLTIAGIMQILLFYSPAVCFRKYCTYLPLKIRSVVANFDTCFSARVCLPLLKSWPFRENGGMGWTSAGSVVVLMLFWDKASATCVLWTNLSPLYGLKLDSGCVSPFLSNCSVPWAITCPDVLQLPGSDLNHLNFGENYMCSLRFEPKISIQVFYF